VLGLQVNMAFSIPGSHPMLTLKMLIGVVWPAAVLDEQDVHKTFPLSTHFKKLLKETGYMHIQSTKPDTVGE
jgi:juvenile hormone epoxide hydrolase